LKKKQHLVFLFNNLRCPTANHINFMKQFFGAQYTGQVQICLLVVLYFKVIENRQIFSFNVYKFLHNVSKS
jgi:hypothetical protein